MLRACGDEAVHRSATFERLRMCVHENAHQQIPERCSGLRFSSFAASLSQNSSAPPRATLCGGKNPISTPRILSSTGRLDGRAANSRALVCVGRLWNLPVPSHTTRPYVKIQTHKSQHALHWKTSLSQQFTTFQHCKFQVESRKHHVWLTHSV